MSLIEKLHEMRANSGPQQTMGLPDSVLARFAAVDASLPRAVDEALAAHRQLRLDRPAALAMAEADLVDHVQSDFVNFYPKAAVNPYVALAARGPWVITSHGGVVHDSGGYGMLGQGHAPDAINAVMAKPWVMANVMTPSFSQKRLAERLRREVGHTRPGGCPFSRFICMNSGSESVTVGSRISDVNATRVTGPGGPLAGAKVKFLGLEGAFHGRTDRPSQVSDSCLGTYKKHLHSFHGRDNLIKVKPNDLGDLEAAFAQANQEGVFIEAMFLEPVQGEGAPGRAVTPAYYALARQLTADHGSLLLVDSIQAGIRGSGTLSVVDYPGFQDLEAPDMETYSKALNAGQYPLSVLALSERAASLYVTGIYGNTMTTNPRALEVACEVLDAMTPALRANIRARGVEAVERLQALQAELPEIITSVMGTGLLFAAELDPSFGVVGFDSIEERCRKRGLGVVHGGVNALRFTPHFMLSSEELQMMVSIVRDVLIDAKTNPPPHAGAH